MAVNDPTPEPSYETDNAGSRSRVSLPSEVTPSATRTPASRQTSPAAAARARRTFFDPWNSSSTGHQRAENRLGGSTSWRVLRNLKLGEQFKGGIDGGKRVADTVGAGSADFAKDGRKESGTWEKGAKDLRTGAQKSLTEVWGASKVGKRTSHEKYIKGAAKGAEEDAHHCAPGTPILQTCAFVKANIRTESDVHAQSHVCNDASRPHQKQVFAGLCFYLNGSTAPLVSDHKLKQLLAAHGASHSIALGRRTVTHVILGTVNAKGGAGGGLAATKIQKEVARTGGKAVKFINAEW